MNLKPELLAALAKLGVSPEETAMLGEKMLSAVTSREAQLNALDAQIRTLSAQRDVVAAELETANATVGKLLDRTS